MSSEGGTHCVFESVCELRGVVCSWHTLERRASPHLWEPQQKAVSVHCVRAVFPTRGPSGWKGSVSVSPDMDVYSSCGQPCCLLKRIHLTVFDVFDTHKHRDTHFFRLGGVGENKRYWVMEFCECELYPWWRWQYLGHLGQHLLY